MPKEFDYTTVEQQIKILRDKGLLFDDEMLAKKRLERYGYYNIINSYKEPYQYINNGKKEYISKTTFEQIYSMFTLDHNLRNSIMASMLDLEACLRSAAAEVISYSFGTDHNSYLNFRNYRDRFSKNPKFTLNGILGALHTNANSDKDPIKYYREKHQIVPPWILLKGTYFSVLINYIKCFKNEQKQHIIRILLHISPDEPITDEIVSLFQNILFVCLDYRNTAAHGGRIYNFESSHIANIKISEELIRIFPVLEDASESSGIGLLIILLSVFKYKQPRTIILNSLNNQLTRHLNLYPDDMNILSNSIKIPIQIQEYVWINEKTRTYHINEHCSGMINAKRISSNDIIALDYQPCKRCIRDIT